ncbi:MAG: 8-amino-7-oxononanoate synthase [Pegethrix bostrychoides GSE-TBD4-15B]|jgi:8-amino-7-oxononanoate synthase|uniref:8-amino-7-oxononanoate synthase n=1 Tax=Pegethrix bostrychoides GSE-TBD4-15B TaxID=2839662 RepID=A0A951U3L5_9CYAN|nr:8-amino-7-oxononanoate synthase [Pegethrix bostrychoides GSE-TBD4-15B]
MEQNAKFAFVKAALAERWQHQRLRELTAVEPLDAVTVQRQGKMLLNFSANDYLGLSKHPALIAAACEFTQRYGTSATASRLVTGSYEIHQQLEAKLAAACGREAALLFSSGFQANATILAAVLDRQSRLLCDRLVHSSLLQGALASGAKLIRYAHNDLDQLEARLRESASYSRTVIVSETLFSMDGDCCDVKAIGQLAERYGAILYLDDAHALGVMGQAGMGLAAYQAGVDLTIGTFGKAFGAFGAFVACSQQLRDYLVNCCAGFIYTTALPPMVIGAVEAALSLMPTLDAERLYLAQQATKLRANLQALGYETAASCSQIVPILLGSEARAMALSEWLEAAGILATPIRPPTVPVGSARIRLALSSRHTDQHYDQLLDAIQSWHG